MFTLVFLPVSYFRSYVKIKHELTQINGYPKWVFEKVNEEYKLSGDLKAPLPTMKVTQAMT